MAYYNFGNSKSNKSSYQNIDPIPQRGRKKCLSYVLISGSVLCIGAVLIFLFFGVESAENPPDLIPSVSNDSDSGNSRLQSIESESGGLNRLGAPAPVQPVEIKTTANTAKPILEDVLVEIDQGLVVGKRMISRAGREYLAFLGIPYARPPLGELRFQPPLEVNSWNGTLDATEFKPDCIQKDKYNPQMVTKGSDDCLYLNIYSPKTLETIKKRRNRFPVMVYIHGGGQFGSGTRYGADYFMDEDVILVTFHYRLGILGNLNTNDSFASGNQGLKDQAMALQWVQDNIKQFGGSNRKVTIFGHSFGAMEVSVHLISPMSNGLFQQAICQSGTEIMPTIFTQNPLISAQDLGKVLNCSENGTKELVDCFKNTEVTKLILSSFLMDFAASVEPALDSVEQFLSDTPLKLLQDGKINRATVMFGGSSGEGLAFSLPILTSPNLTQEFNEDWPSAASEALWLNYSANLKDPDGIANAAREFYLGSNNLSRQVETNFTRMFSDRRVFHPANVFATFQLNKNRRRENVYLYYFNEQGDKSYADSVLEPYGATEFLGAGHGDELQFLFPYDPYPPVPLGSKHANFSQMLVRRWVSFAATGKPNVGNGAEWLPIERDKPHRWFEINSYNPQMIDFLEERMNFWDSFNLTDLYV